MTVLRPDLLQGEAIALAGETSAAIGDAMRDLGATIEELDPRLDENAAEQWASHRPALRALLFDSRPIFGNGGRDALTRTLERAWVTVRGVAAGALIAAERPTTVVLIGAAPDAGVHAEAVRAGLENLARTLSVEWARYAVSTVAVMPGTDTSDEQLAELSCFLVSRAGEYFSGCRLSLGTTSPASRR